MSRSNERVVSVGRHLRGLSDGVLRGVAPLIHRSVTAAELAVLPRVDSRGHDRPSPQENTLLVERVTMVVKTFERPDVARRLVRTARTVFPGRIIVADDSATPLSSLGPGVDIVALPFNVGLSAGRNAALAHVATEFVFLTDDDIVFTAATDIVAMVEYLDEHPGVDVIAPDLVNLPWLYTSDRRQSPLFAGARPPIRPFGEVIGGAVVVPKVANVFLARTASLREIGWDDRLRLVEHRDFFTRASGRLVCVQADGVRAYHVRTPYDAHYMSYRQDTAEAMSYLGQKWSGRHDPGSDSAEQDIRQTEQDTTHEGVTMTAAAVIHEGIDFGEGPRWRDGRLWFSDFYRHAVFTLDSDGTETKVVDVPGQPSGLGWLPDGRLLVTSMTDQKVLRLESDGTLVEHADVSGIARFHSNDLITDGEGRVYVGDFGYDLHADMEKRDIPTILGDESAGATSLALVQTDGTVEVAADGVRFPNGMALIDDGRTLVLAETLRLQLTAFDVAADGRLSNRRVYASTAAQMAAPDGICADPEGGIWVATALSPSVLRFAEGGEVTGSVETSQIAYACALGGEDGRTLYTMTAPSSEPSLVKGKGLGRIEAARV